MAIDWTQQRFSCDKKLFWCENEQLDGFQYGGSNLRGTAYENGGLEGSRATVHEKAPAYRVMNKRSRDWNEGGSRDLHKFRRRSY